MTSNRDRSPVAVVGLSFRLPGARGESLWQALLAGRDLVSAVDSDRWTQDSLLHPNKSEPGTSYTFAAGSIGDVAGFDAGFFGISPREAEQMDPQQRLLLEMAWEAFEQAGIPPSSMRGSRCGVYVGLSSVDYAYRRADDLGAIDSTTMTGGAGSIAANRISYVFDLHGPSMVIDTACSSSLVAMHLAAQALRGGECSLALAGGVTVLATPTVFTEFSRQRGLAPDGRCKPFAAAADGTGISEGVGLVLLERLSDAQRNGHEVLALVRGSATNQDGASNGPTAPNGPSQERVIRQALASAGLSPAEVDAVEAHGTGTTLGDPIEAQALLATYGQGREEGEPLRLGAIKSNLGHTQAAAGVAGVIKMALAMRHGVLPKTLHLDQPTPHVDWEAGAVELLSEAQPWEAGERPRRAGVSSFGISGTNAHLILEEAPAKESAAEGLSGKPAEGEPGEQAPPMVAIPLPLSAKGEDALRDQALRLAAHLQSNPELDPTDVGFSLATTRAKLPHRATAIGKDREELLGALGAQAAGEPHSGLLKGRAGTGKFAFVFPGQGSQYINMGLRLYRSEVRFRETVDRCAAALSSELGCDIRDLLFPAPPDAEMTVISPRSGRANKTPADRAVNARAVCSAICVYRSNPNSNRRPNT